MKPWIVKYAPKNTCDIPQDSVADKLRLFVSDFKKQKKKAVLLYGPSGSCKSCSVHALACEKGLEIVEVNASDVRNADKINEKLGNALKQQSLFSKGKIILVDEIDGISGTKDRGGIPALSKLVSKSVFPVFLTANDPFNKKFNSLRKQSVKIEFSALDYIPIYKILKNICVNENIVFEDSALKTLARRAGGDLRAAINDLQSLAFSKKITKNMIDSLSERNQIGSIENALIKVLKNSDPVIALSAFNDVGLDLDKCFLWVDNNMPKEYSLPDDLVRAYECISRADVFRGRIRRWQHWRFLVYVNMLLTAGVACAKDKKYKSSINYEQTRRFLKVWQANMKYAKRKAIAQKIAEKTHCSTKRALHSTLPYIKAIFQNNKKVASQLADEFDFDGDECTWLSS
ncbi:replication factor C large subunit [Candidatus Woesearchaeota archaeon]|nr:replication factor C large subunit [Candidatus Woesearchaeota archaeon]MBW2978496.1 replication factor C large subunit [Candidatus Woesearchaeota archaeon]